MKNYRLKKEAYPFFKEHLATTIESWDFWKDHNVHEDAIEEVEEVNIVYGHRNNSSNHKAGWREKEGTHFHFTINYPSMKYQEYDKFSNGQVIRALMDKFQRVANQFYQDFANGEAQNQQP